MSRNFHIPSTPKAILADVAKKSALVSATGWELAAELAAIVRFSDKPGRPVIGKSANYKSTVDIAKLSLRGLSSHHTVERYVEGWLAAHDGIYPEPGETVELPSYDWPPTTLLDQRYQIEDKEAITAQAEADGTGAAKAVDIAKNTKAMAAAIKASPRVAAAAAEALRDRVEDIPSGTDLASPTESWKPTRESKMRHAVVQMTDAIAILTACIEEDDLSAEETELRNTAIDAAIEFAATHAGANL